MAIAISGTPDGGAQHRRVTPSRPGSSRNTEAEQIEKEAFDNAFEPTLRTQSQEHPCYICEKYTRFQLKCRACEWLTCPMCKECFDHFHSSCVQPTEYDEEIPELQTESEKDSDKVEEYWRKIRMRGLLTLRHRGSPSASSSSWTPQPVAPPHWIRCKICFKCKRATKNQKERCDFCKRPCCHNCMKWMVCCQKWKCNECTCFCQRDKLRAIRFRRDRARIAYLKSQGEGKRSGSDKETRGRTAVRTPDGDIVCRRGSPATKRSSS
jgi:hypothetical protein